jgi:hypothetical protein
MRDLRKPAGKIDGETEVRNLVERINQLEIRLGETTLGKRRGFDDPLLAKVAEAILRSRQRRALIFPSGLFAEPAWDMLLDLFVNDVRGLQVPTTSLCLASGVAPTTALRSLAMLEVKELIRRHPSRDDRRVILVELSAKGRGFMRQGLTDVALRIRGLVPD